MRGLQRSVGTIRIATARFARVAALAKRQIEARSGTKVLASGEAALTLDFEILSGIGSDGFRIEDGPGDAIRIIGSNQRGLLYGLGKFLRSSGYANGVLTPSSWRSESVPDKPIRGAYLATHFHNFYHDAPLREVERYLEDIALWGINTVAVWFDMHHYRSIDDPDAQLMIARLRSLLTAAKELGLDTALLFLANEAYADSPEPLRADHTSGHDGYFASPRGHFHIELCPHRPGAKQLMLKWVEERLKAFADIAPDYLVLWPYDCGGCTCSQCAPWGCNGYLAMAEPTARLYRQHVPHGKVILSTWYFDHFIQGEWAGLDRAFRNKPAWVDYIMADDNNDQFPEYPLQRGVPGGLPLLSFPEISMYKSLWGGIGANPLPHHLQALWDMAGKHLAGGFPYSEGIFEDLNKAVLAQLQWKPDRPAMDMVREYIGFESSPDVVADVTVAVGILEQNIQHSIKEENGIHYLPMERSTDAVRAWSLLKSADARLPVWARKSWRWRILYLRGLIDSELAANDFRITDRCEEAFQELVGLYHAQKAALSVSPPTKEALREKRSW